jgi:ribosome-associated heat shock protein Hsp15
MQESHMAKANKSNPAAGANDPLTVRLDKWLQVARVFKTRSQATEALDAGHVKMEGRRAKASHVVKPGDEIEVTKGARRLFITVKGIAAKPIPAQEARELLEVREEVDQLDNLSPDQIETLRAMRAMDRAMQASRKGLGRPTKRDRRDIEKNRGR